MEAKRLQLDVSGENVEVLCDGVRYSAADRNGDLFSVSICTTSGDTISVGSSTARSRLLTRASNGLGDAAVLLFERLGGERDLGIDVRIDVESVTTGAVEWRAHIVNRSEHFVERICFGGLRVGEVLVDDGGEGGVFLPYAEGVLVSGKGSTSRQEHLSAQILYPSHFNDLSYPGALSMQFAAYLSSSHGIYVGVHDARGGPKNLSCVLSDDGVMLGWDIYCCVEPHSTTDLGYPIVWEAIEGRWESAAERYRTFVEKSEFPLPPKVQVANATLSWLMESPVVAVYPPRGIRGSGYIGPNEFFPLVRSIKYLDDLSDDIDSPLLALLTYWEGGAPWAPPYLWPPYGGAAEFDEFVDEAHKHSHRVGVYGSGLGWTERSLLIPEYDRSEDRIRDGIGEAFCAGPRGDLRSEICIGIRDGYDMCASSGVAVRITLDQVRAIASSGVDFIQYMDQNVGGRSYLCYSAAHGHPPVFGPWSTWKMSELQNQMVDEISSAGASALLGAESASADVFLRWLRLNDLRYPMGFAVGRPVPAYSFVFHEYVVNFQGNGSPLSSLVDKEVNPDIMLFTTAYSFVAGDLLTVVLKSGGELHWEWGHSWLDAGPRQVPYRKLVRNLSAMRRGLGEPYLVAGRMVSANPVRNVPEFRISLRDGTEYNYGSVLTTKWVAPTGEYAQILVNYSVSDSVVEVQGSPLGVFWADQYQDFSGVADEEGWFEIHVPALSAVGVVLEERSGLTSQWNAGRSQLTRVVLSGGEARA